MESWSQINKWAYFNKLTGKETEQELTEGLAKLKATNPGMTDKAINETFTSFNIGLTNQNVLGGITTAARQKSKVEKALETVDTSGTPEQTLINLKDYATKNDVTDQGSFIEAFEVERNAQDNVNTDYFKKRTQVATDLGVETLNKTVVDLSAGNNSLRETWQTIQTEVDDLNSKGANITPAQTETLQTTASTLREARYKQTPAETKKLTKTLKEIQTDSDTATTPARNQRNILEQELSLTPDLYKLVKPAGYQRITAGALVRGEVERGNIRNDTYDMFSGKNDTNGNGFSSEAMESANLLVDTMFKARLIRSKNLAEVDLNLVQEAFARIGLTNLTEEGKGEVNFNAVNTSILKILGEVVDSHQQQRKTINSMNDIDSYLKGSEEDVIKYSDIAENEAKLKAFQKSGKAK